tara:strand:- start:7045 stop:8001 length:957 start_codon:yes stop_codon:yes gene_type:complete
MVGKGEPVLTHVVDISTGGGHGSVVEYWWRCVEARIKAYRDTPHGLRTEEMVGDIVEIILDKDFYYGREVYGVHLPGRGHSHTYERHRMARGSVRQKREFVRCDFLIRPKPHLTDVGFPDRVICIEVKRNGKYRDHIAQVEDYNTSVFFIDVEHADADGYARVPNTALRPSFTFIFDALCGVAEDWPHQELPWKGEESSQSQRGIGFMGIDRGWAMYLESNVAFAKAFIPSEEHTFESDKLLLQVNRNNPTKRKLASRKVDFETFDGRIFRKSIKPSRLWVPRGRVNERENKPRIKWYIDDLDRHDQEQCRKRYKGEN